MNPGCIIAGKNYEPGISGGYRRIDGYERYDGRPSPSDASYYHMDVTLSATVSVGDTVTGVTSGATGVVAVSESTYLDVTKIVGTFQAEDITVSGSVVGSITATPVEGEDTAFLDAVAQNASADIYRDDIQKPGTTVYGLGMLNGVLYCFADGKIYKPSASGWVEVPLYSELSFDSGVGLISDGDAITQLSSGATADVKRVVLEAGEWGTDAAGRLILDNIVGTFDNTNDLQVSGTTQATSTSTVSAITLTTGGRYETIEHNFYATGSKRMYGCDGVNYGFEFDGDVYVPIHTGMPTDAPTHVIAHKSMLFFLFDGGSQMNSGIGTPYEYTAISGALDLGLGDTGTGFGHLQGNALGIFSRNQSKQLLGNNNTDFVLDNISSDAGCLPWTIQNMGNLFGLDDRGIVVISQTQKYGNFELSALSRPIQKEITRFKKHVIASCVYRDRNQYRLYGDDGSGIIMTVRQKGIDFSVFEYPVTVSAICSGEDTDGDSVVYFADTDGWVYQADKGSSFDGEEIEAFLILPFNHVGSPTVRKAWRKMFFDIAPDLYTSIKVSADFSYADSGIPETVIEDVQINGLGGYWDVDNFGEFFYDAPIVNSEGVRVSGVGTNISAIVYSKSDIDLGHDINGVILHYTLRRLKR
jgi:hypothetical protein